MSPTGQPAVSQSNFLDLFKGTAPTPMGPLVGLGMFLELELNVMLLPLSVVMMQGRKALPMLSEQTQEMSNSIPHFDTCTAHTPVMFLPCN